MGVYDSQITMAKRLIAAKGRSVTWQQQGVVVADPSKPWITSDGASTNFPCVVAFLPPNSGLLYRLLAGSNVAQSNSRGLMAVQPDFTPTIDDKVLTLGRVLALASLDSLQVNDQVIIWKMEFKV